MPPHITVLRILSKPILGPPRLRKRLPPRPKTTHTNPRRAYKVSGDSADIEVECEGKAKSDVENWFGDLFKKILPGKRELSGYYKKGDGSIVGNTWDPGTLLDVIKKRNQK